MFRAVEPTWRLNWLKRKYKLSEHLDGGSRTFGPYHARGAGFHVRYDAETDGWYLLQHVDTSVAESMARRNTIVELAEEHRGRMPRGEFVRLLILACIYAGINRRPSILEAVDRAANSPAIQEHLETGKDLVATEFGEAYVAGVLARYRGKRPSKHLWWVDTGGIYHVNEENKTFTAPYNPV